MDTFLLIDVCNLLSLLSEVHTLLNKVLNFSVKWLAIVVKHVFTKLYTLPKDCF